MKKLSKIFVLLALTVFLGTGNAMAVPVLTNSNITAEQFTDLFSYDPDYPLISGMYDFAPANDWGDGMLYSQVYTGDGMYAYLYQAVVFYGATEVLSGIHLPFSHPDELVTLDFDGDDVATDTSFYIGDVALPGFDSYSGATVAPSHFPGTLPNITEWGSLTFSFLPPDNALSPAIPNGSNTFVFGVVTTDETKPIEVIPNIDNSSDQLRTPSVYAAPTPEPATLLLLGSGMMGFAVIRRKFKKR